MGSLPKKKVVVDKVRLKLEGARVALVTDFRGLSVGEMKLLRRELAQADSHMTVVKNTLMRRVLEGSDMAPLSTHLKGPTAVVFGKGDQVQPIKIIKDFFKKNKKKDNDIRGGCMDGQSLSQADVEALASLPPLAELQAKLLGGIVYPLRGIAGAIGSQNQALVRCLAQVADIKEKQGA